MYIRTCIYAYINIIEHSRFNGLITLFIRASQSVSIKYIPRRIMYKPYIISNNIFWG